MAKGKTLEELTAMARAGKATFTADDIAGVMGCNAHTIRLWAKQAPQFLPEPMRSPIITGQDPDNTNYARVRFPAIPVLRYFGVNI